MATQKQKRQENDEQERTEEIQALDETKRKKRKTQQENETKDQDQDHVQESSTEQHVQEQEVEDGRGIQSNEVIDNATATETTRKADEREMLLSEVKALLSHLKDTEKEADSGGRFQKAKNWVDAHLSGLPRNCATLS